MKRKYSLKRNKEFRYIYRTGKSVSCRCLVVIYKKNQTGLLHIGLSVSKKIGNSVTRNLIKRRLRASLDKYIDTLNPNYNLIIIARKPILETSFQKIGESFDYLFKKAGLYNNTKNKEKYANDN